MKDQEFEAILQKALCPEVDPADIIIHDRGYRKGSYTNMKKVIKKACTAAAILLLLFTTVYATDALSIKTLLSGASSRRFETVEQAEEKAGFTVDSKKSFPNGYTFKGARTNEVKGLDQDDRVRLTYEEINVEYVNRDGNTIVQVAHEQQDGVDASDRAPDQTRKIGDITVSYRLDHYKFVPADYELTETDREMEKVPGNYISYGADEVQEKNVAFLNWEKDGICYMLMDRDADETVESLFSMAWELILG